MRISHKYKLIFLSNPKTGSTSIRNVLDPISEIKSGITDKNLFHHLKAKDAVEYLKKQGYEWNEYISITTIRNPYARAVSNYFYSKPDKNGKHFYDKDYDVNSKFGIDFNSWLKMRLENKTSMAGLISYEEFCCDDNGNCLVDFVFPIERIDELLPSILSRLGIVYDKKIPVVNTTEHESYKTYYNDESIKMIKDKYKKDIEVGGYEF